MTIAVAVFGVCAVLLLLNVFEPLELKSCYSRFKLRGEGNMHPDIALVGISHEDIEIAEEPLPWPRDYFADMISILGYHKARVIALDVAFSTPKDPKSDSILAESIAKHPNAITSFYFELGVPPPDADFDRETVPRALAIRPESEKDRDVIEGIIPRWPIRPLRLPGQAGFVNAPLEEDGTLLRLPLVIKHRGYVFPSLVLTAACRYFDVRVQDVIVTPGRFILLRLSQGKTIRIPIDRQGRMVINFQAGQRILEERSASFMLTLKAEVQRQSGEKPDLDLSSINGKAVFVAGLLTTAKDICTTPLGRTFGVSAHVNALSNILTGEFLYRPGPAITLLVLAVCSLACASLAVEGSLLRGTVGSVALLLGYLLFSWFVFLRGRIWIEVVAPAVNIVVLYAAIATYRFFAEEHEKARIRGLFARYLSPEAVEEVLGKPEDLIFEGELKGITVLLSDIRDFTGMTEELGAAETVAMLNEYFAPMSRIIHKHEGAVNQFVGDEILATWGAPKAKATDALNAVKAALEMREELAALMVSRKERGLKTFAIGIGLNTGEAKVGNIGTEEHMDYAVIGDTINYAARLESLTKEYRSAECPTAILMSQSTYERVKDEVDATLVGEVKVKGKKAASPVYMLNGLRKNNAAEK